MAFWSLGAFFLLSHGTVPHRDSPVPARRHASSPLPLITPPLSLSNSSLWLSCNAPAKALLPRPFCEVYFCLWTVLTQGNCASIIGMPLVFPWALGLRTLASLGAMSFVQMRSWSLCVPDTVALGVQGSLPAQILSRNVLMSGSSCVLPAHASQRHPALLWAAHGSLAFSSRQCYLAGGLTSVPTGHLNTTMLHRICEFLCWSPIPGLWVQ